MGKLAMFGALAGAGATVAKLGDEKAKAMAKQQQDDIAEARERRIAQFNSGLRMEEQSAQNVFTGTQNAETRNTQRAIAAGEQAGMNQRTEAELGVRQEEAGAERTFKGNEGSADRTLRREEGAADRQNRKDIANIEAGAREKAARANKDKDRFFIQKVQREKPPKKGEALGEKYEISQVVDRDTGQTFEQNGDKFLPQGGQVQILAHPNNVAALMQNRNDPAAIYEFLDHYGYLPASVFVPTK